MTTEKQAVRKSTINRLGSSIAQLREHHTCPCDFCVRALEFLERAEAMLQEMS